MIHKLIWMTAVICILTTAIDAQEPLMSYLETAAQNNPELLAGYQDYIAALQVGPQVGSLPDPKLMFGYFIEPVETRVGPQQAKISLDQMFPWFGVLDAREQAAAEKAKARFENFIGIKNKLFYEIQSLYYQLFYYKQSIYLIEKNLKLKQSIRNLAQIKAATGKTSAADEYRTEMAINELEQQLALLNDKYQMTLISFKTLLNNPDPQEITLPDTLWYTGFSVEKATLIDSVYRRNPRLRSLEHTEQALMEKEKEARRSGWPNLTLGVDYIVTGKRNTNGIELDGNGQDAIIFPRIGFSLPIFRAKYSAMEDEAIANRQAVEYQKEQTINELKEQSEEIYLDFVDAERRMDLYRRQLLLATKTFNILQSEYTADRIGLDELLQMEQQMLGFQLDVERAKVDRETAIAFINYLSAKMIGSETYEPQYN